MNPSNGTCLYWNKVQESKLKTWLVWIVTKVQLYTQYKQCTVSQNIGKTTLLYRVLQKDSILRSKLITPERGIMSTIKIKKNRGSLQHPVMQCCLLTLETCFSLDKCSDNVPLQVVPRFSLLRVTFSRFAKFSASLLPLKGRMLAVAVAAQFLHHLSHQLRPPSRPLPFVLTQASDHAPFQETCVPIQTSNLALPTCCFSFFSVLVVISFTIF